MTKSHFQPKLLLAPSGVQQSIYPVNNYNYVEDTKVSVSIKKLMLLMRKSYNTSQRFIPDAGF